MSSLRKLLVILGTGDGAGPRTRLTRCCRCGLLARGLGGVGGVTVAGVTAILVERRVRGAPPRYTHSETRRGRSPTTESTAEEGAPIHEVFIKDPKNRVSETDSDAQDTASLLCRKRMRE